MTPAAEQLVSTAWQFVMGLRGEQRRLAGFWWNPAPVAPDLGALADEDPVTTIPALCHLHRAGCEAITRQTRHVLGLHFPSLASHQWIHLAEGLRTGWEHDAPRSVPTSYSCQIECILDHFHHSGYVRSAALAGSAVIPLPLRCSLALLRANDWVAEVREVARGVLDGCVDNLAPAQKLALAQPVHHLGRCGRSGGSEHADRWMERLAHGIDEDLWIKVWTRAPGRQRAGWFALLQVSALPMTERLGRAIVRGGYGQGVRWIIRTQFPAMTGGLRERFGKLLGSAKMAAIRAEWLEVLAQHDPVAAHGLLENGLLDRSATVRFLARYYLGKSGFEDFATFYERRLTGDPPAPEALLGLAEVAPQPVHEHAVELLIHAEPVMRAAAISVLDVARLEPLFPTLSAFLQDSNHPRTAKAAFRKLGKAAREFGAYLIGDPGRLLDLVGKCPKAMGWLPSFAKWDAWEALLILAAQPEHHHAASNHMSRLASKLNSSFVRLDATRRSRLMQLLERSLLAPSENQFIRRLIGTGA